MYKIIDETYMKGYKSGALETMDLLNSLDLFDHLSEEEMEEIQHKIISLIESK